MKKETRKLPFWQKMCYCGNKAVKSIYKNMTMTCWFDDGSKMELRQ